MENNNVKIELSEAVQRPVDMLQWALNVKNKVELSEEEVAISESVNEVVRKADKFGSRQAKDTIAQLIVEIVEPILFEVPDDLLEKVLNFEDIGEFDAKKIYQSPKNTLVAYESAPRTGNVKKSYINFEKGITKEAHLQIETELKMSNLRRAGALGVAEATLMVLEAFRYKKFKTIIGFIEEIIGMGGDNYIAGASLTTSMVNQFVDYLNQNNIESDYSEIIGLTSMVTKFSRESGADTSSDVYKDELLRKAKIKEVGNCLLFDVKDGKKLGNGEKLLPDKKLFGFAGTIGSAYNKGEMRSYVIEDGNTEVISLKFTGVEFGVSITNPERIAILELS